MICLTNVYKEIMEDFANESYLGSEVLFRKFKLKNNIIVLISVYRSSSLAEVSFSLMDCDSNIVKFLPKWKGMEERVIAGLSENVNQLFLSFIQSEEYNKKIYFLVLQDILDNLSKVESSKMLSTIKKTLENWKVFFQFEKNFVLSDNVQQGLYGELYVLNKLLSIYGEKALDCWTGCNAETHDFYFNNNALEVKCSKIQSNEIVRISNEYQLDDSSIIGKLHLMHLKVRKSEKYGDNLPYLVNVVSNRLSDSKKLQFYDKLLKVGYVYQMPELYTICFYIQDESCYLITDEFPKITKKDLPKGISSVDYTVNLSGCEKFLITVEDYYREVDL